MASLSKPQPAKSQKILKNERFRVRSWQCLFSWSVNVRNGEYWPIDYYLAWYLQGLVALSSSLWLHFLLPAGFEEKCQGISRKSNDVESSGGVEEEEEGSIVEMAGEERRTKEKSKRKGSSLGTNKLKNGWIKMTSLGKSGRGKVGKDKYEKLLES